MLIKYRKENLIKYCIILYYIVEFVKDFIKEKNMQRIF